MGFFSFGRIVGAFFNQLFRWLFWNKTGQKILFIFVIAFILVAFVKLGEVAAVEPDDFGSYDQLDFDGVLSNCAISSGNKLYSVEGSSYNVYYIELNPYNYYSVVVNSTSNRLAVHSGFTNSLSIGSLVSDGIRDIVPSGSSVDRSFYGNNGYKYFVIYSPVGIPEIYYNAYPYEVTAMRSSLVSYAYKLYPQTHFDSSSSEYNQCTWFFPIKKGFSYRVIYNGNQFSSGSYSFGFLNSYNGESVYYNSKNPNLYNANYDTGIELLSILTSGSDFVAPDDGYIILPGVLGSPSSYQVFSSQSDISITANNSSVNNNLNNVNSSINNVNDSLTDSSISDNNDDYVLPESGVTDIADSGFANIFDKLRTAFTQESSGQGLVVQVPFTDKSFTISKNTVFGNAQLGIVGTLINSFWYFLVSLWIVKDIAHKMNMIKSGNIELAQTSNIKEDLL